MSLNPALATHYRQLLGLTSPWRITDIDMQIAEQRVDISIEWPEGKRVRCPECDTLCALKDHRDVRTWRHLDIMQFQTFLHCRVPSAECRTHGARTIDVPLSTPHSRWTLLYEAFAVPVIEQVPALTKVATILQLSWGEVFALRNRAVERRLLRREVEEAEYRGIDEKSFGKKERFIAVLKDINRDFGATRFAQSRIGRTWMIKEAFRIFWNYVSVGCARKYFKRWYFWAMHSRINAVIRVARSLKAHLEGKLNYFRHGITNAFSEGINSKIQGIKSAARGFRNFENYRIAILFHC